MEWTNTGRTNTSRPKCTEMKELGRTDINPLLYDLLAAGCPNPDEEPVRAIIKAAVKKAGLNVEEGSTEFLKDDYGNLWVDTRTTPDHKMMFSSHMDIVARESNTLSLYMIPDGPKEGMIYGAYRRKCYNFFDIKDQEKSVDFKAVLNEAKITQYSLDVTKTKSKDGKLVKVNIIDTIKKEKTDLTFWAKHVQNMIYPSTLGADDKVGVYIMLRMIQKKVPGLYVFHVGEERGGLGSKYIFTNYKDSLKNLDACVAFDRAGYGDVISTQRVGRTASAAYTNDLAALLNEHMPPMQRFKGDIGGAFTDSASYFSIIPECTNLSVGYFDQHGANEHLDYVWLDSILLPAILKLNWAKAKPVRDPTPPTTFFRNQERRVGFHGGGSYYNNDYSDTSWHIDPTLVTKDTPLHRVPDWKPSDGILEGVTEAGMRRIIESYAVDLTPLQERTDAIYKLVLALKDVTDHYVAARKYIIANGGNVEEVDFADTDGDPNGSYGQHVEVPAENAILCKRCLREARECVCMPIRTEYKTDTEYNYAVALWTNSNKEPATLRPVRANYKDDASFEADLGTYLESLDIKADIILGKTRNIVDTLADPEVKEKLEK